MPDSWGSSSKMALAARIGDKLPYFISYDSVMKKNENEFKKWVESVEWVYKTQKYHTEKKMSERKEN